MSRSLADREPADAPLRASMLVIGDEILGGYVVDANSPLLAVRLRTHGVPLDHVHVVPDEFDAIDEALRAELARERPRLVVTSGGIGSTPDDITFEAVAASLGRDLEEEPTIAERLRDVVERARSQGLDTSEEFRSHLFRMARVPAGSRMLRRHGSWLPAVVVDVDGGCDAGGVSVVILPGVPSEFRLLVEDAVEPQLVAGRNEIPTMVEIEHALPESALNRTFARLSELWPTVRLGSYPGRPMIVRLTGPRDAVEDAAALMRAALDEIEAMRKP